ncbi:mechanosensitive ion channel domain-containing protein [Chloroflexota bacterium]
MIFWDWITFNSIWIFIVSSVVLIILFFLGELILNRITKSLPETRRELGRIIIGYTLPCIEIIAVLIIIVALVVVVIAREGAQAIVTPEMIQLWLLEHGVVILILLMVGAALWGALKKFLPPFIKRMVARPVKGESREGMNRRADTLSGVFLGIAKAVLIIIILFMVLSELSVNIAPVLAGFGIAGIAVGFGAQYLIRDLIAGIFILMENQYRVGDVARVSDIAGLVEEVNLRKTVLRDLDGVVHHVPNGEIKVASNFSRHFARVNFDISVSYGTDLDEAIKVINQVCLELASDEKWSKSLKTTPKVLRVNKLGDSGIEIKILGDVKPLEQWAVTGELKLRLKKAFDKAGIEIPWPHTKLFFGNSMPANMPLICKSCNHPNQAGSAFCAQCGASMAAEGQDTPGKKRTPKAKE